VLNEELATLSDGTKERLAGLEMRVEDLTQMQAVQSKVIRRQDDRLKKALSVVASALAVTETGT